MKTKDATIPISSLVGVSETMLIPLWARATETSKENSIIQDHHAVKIVEHLDYDFTKFEKSWKSQVGCAIRAKLFDQATQDFIRQNPNCTVINIGCGLDTRFMRLKNEAISKWYELDLPVAIEQRRKFLEESERNIFLPKSVFDLSWMGDIEEENSPVLIIAEGIVMYFTEEKTKLLLECLGNRFPNAHLLIETMGPMMAKNSHRHDSVNLVSSAPRFLWGIKDTKDMEQWNDNLRYITEWNFFDYYAKRWKWMRWLFYIPGFKQNVCNRITHFKFIKR